MRWHAHIAHGLQQREYASRQLTFLLILLLFSFLLLLFSLAGH
jgi:hypothetical protein